MEAADGTTPMEPHGSWVAFAAHATDPQREIGRMLDFC
jgi:hypothetical protein